MAINNSGYKRKKRNSFRRARKPIVFLAAEGKNKTETLYFRDLRQDVNCIFRFAPGNHTAPVNMVNELKYFLDENDFSQDLPLHLFDKAIRILRKSSCRTAEVYSEL